MDEATLKTSIATYKLQLDQVESAIQAAGGTDDLLQLRDDLRELVQLTEGSLLSLKKSEILKSLDGHDENEQGEGQSSLQSRSAGSLQNGDMDAEYAEFQALLQEHATPATNHLEGASNNRTDIINCNTDTHALSNTEFKANTNSVYLSIEEGKNRSNSVNQSVDDGSDKRTSAELSMEDVSDLYREIMWSKCRARYRQDWGETTYNNALIVGIEPHPDSDMPKVRVMFTNPTQAAMLPCKYQLEDSCKFTEDSCRFSHGYLVNLEDLQEYEEPDYRKKADYKAKADDNFRVQQSRVVPPYRNHDLPGLALSNLRVGMTCRARYENDDLWYKSTVVDIGSDNLTVMYDNYGDDGVELPFGDVWPIYDENSDSDSESVDDQISQPISREESDEEELPAYLWKPQSHGLGDLGQWEAHTTGIGSRLMTKMGYIPGQGLGKDGEGRVDPIPIQLLPQGKSLDKIMALKAIAGDRDLFDVLEKQKKKAKPRGTSQKPQRQTVFDFMNKKLGGKKGNVNELVHHHAHRHENQGQGQGKGHGRMHRNISEHDLTKKSERHINVQLLKTSEEMRSVEKELSRLKQSLSRNENRDKNIATQVKQKIQSMETYMEKLKTSELTMQQHQQQRTDQKKLTIF